MSDDLISRQAAIDAILHNQEVYSNNFGNDPIDKYTIAIIDNDAQTIAQLPSAQPEQRWIPVTERLPEPNEIEENGCLRHYLTQNDYGDMMVCSWNGFKWEQIYQLEPTDDEIIAWMPLPEPWKGEDDADNS